MGIVIEFDARQLDELREILGPKLYGRAVKRLFVDAALRGQAIVVPRTPRVTGNLRRSEEIEVRDAGRLPNPESRVFTRAEYAGWIETGEDSRGRKMKSRPGGYRMFEQTARQMEAREIEAIAERALDEITKEWAA